MKETSIYKYNAPQVPHDAVPKPWSVALRGNKLFVYWKREMTPRFTFTKRHSTWTGHGIEARSIKKCMEHVLEHSFKLNNS